MKLSDFPNQHIFKVQVKSGSAYFWTVLLADNLYAAQQQANALYNHPPQITIVAGPIGPILH